MPATNNDKELPSTLQRSPAKAKRTWAKAHDSAAETYGEGERAHRTAYAALKHSFEKRGDHWEPKRSKGPSDPQRRSPRRRRAPGRAGPMEESTPGATPRRSCWSGRSSWACAGARG